MKYRIGKIASEMTALGETVSSITYSGGKTYRVSELLWVSIKMLISPLDVNKGHCLSVMR